MTNFGQVSFSGAGVSKDAGTSGGLSAFDAQEITMADSTNGTIEAQPSSLSSNGSVFSVAYESSGGGGLSGLRLGGIGLGL